MREVYRCILHTILFNRAVGWVRPKDTECEVLTRISYARIDDPALVRTIDKNVDALYAMIEKQAQARRQPTVTTTTVIAPSPTAQPALSSSSSSSPPPHSASPAAAALAFSSSSSSSPSSSSPSAAASAPVLASFSLSFYETTPSKSWFGPREERLYWERWIIPCAVSPHSRHTTADIGASASPADSAQRRQEEAFMLVMTAVVSLVNEKKEHLPSVKAGKEGLTYSFECQSECMHTAASATAAAGGAAVGTAGGSSASSPAGAGDGGDGGWGLMASMMKKVFKEGPPLLIPR